MKKDIRLSLTTLLFIFFSIILQAQKVKVQEKEVKMSQGTRNGLTVEIPEADEKDVEKTWKKKMKKDFNAKTSNSKGEVFADDAEIKSISDNTVDVYAKAEEKKGNVRFTVFFNLGGVYLNSKDHSAHYKYVEKMLEDFAKEVAVNTLEEQLKEEEKNLKKLKNDQEKLVSDKEKLKSDIEDYKQRIKKAEEDIKENEKEQGKKKEEVAKQTKVVEEISQKLSKIK